MILMSDLKNLANWKNSCFTPNIYMFVGLTQITNNIRSSSSLLNKSRTDSILNLVLWFKPPMNASCNLIACWLESNKHFCQINSLGSNNIFTDWSHDTNKPIKLFYFTTYIISGDGSTMHNKCCLYICTHLHSCWWPGVCLKCELVLFLMFFFPIRPTVINVLQQGIKCIQIHTLYRLFIVGVSCDMMPCIYIRDDNWTAQYIRELILHAGGSLVSGATQEIDVRLSYR